MTPGDNCARLVRRIAGILSGGIRVKADVRHFIESTFGGLSLEALGAFLRDESDCERDTLLDLLFFPDEPFQMQIEDLLADLELTPADIEETTVRLGRLKPAARFFFGGHLPPLIVEMPDFCAAGFVSRLKIWKKTDPALAAVIGRSMDKAPGRRVRVRLRNSRFDQTPQRVDFLCRLIRKTAHDQRFFGDGLDLVIGMLDEQQQDGDLFTALGNHKKRLFRQLQQIDAYEKKLKKGNVETLMLGRMQCPCLNAADTRRKMTLIDRVSRTCFGRVVYFEPADSVCFSGKEALSDGHGI